MMRFLLLPLFALTLAAQTPSFEVASIRPARPTSPGSLCNNLKLSPESLLLSAVWRLGALIEDAYRNEVDDFDHPQWLPRETFAINVRVPPNTNVDTCRLMVRNLLAERFHLVVDVETRDVARYRVKVAKSGLKLKTAGPAADPKTDISIDIKDGLARQTFRGAPMSRIMRAIEVSAVLNNPGERLASVSAMVDETGLTGYYDGEFVFSATASLRSEFADSVEDALSRQLGLTLERWRGLGKVLVVKSSDPMPTEN